VPNTYVPHIIPRESFMLSFVVAGVINFIVFVPVVASDVLARDNTPCNTKFVPSYITVFMLAVAISPSRGSLPSISLIDLAQRLFTLTVQAPVLAVANLSVSF